MSSYLSFIYISCKLTAVINWQQWKHSMRERGRARWSLKSCHIKRGERERGGAEFSQREKRALLAEFWQPLNFLLVYRFSTFKTKKMQRRVFTCHSCCQCHTSAAAVAWQMRCDKAKSVWPLPKTKTSCHTQPIPHAIPPAIPHPCSVLGSKCCHISESATN